MSRQVVGLLTDFGTRDHYVSSMKGVLLKAVPDVQLIDISHEIAPGDITEAGWVLNAAWRDLPEGSVVVCVVDPGVGSERRGIAIQAHGRRGVGPDNGTLELVARGSTDGEAVELTVRALWRHPVSPTFHGRDIFAPIAARLATGAALREVGDAIDSIVPYPIRPPQRRPDGSAAGHVVHVDRFGNVVTDIGKELVPRGSVTVGVGSVVVGRLVSFYAEADADELVAVINSSGHLELAMRGARAIDRLNVKRGAVVEVLPAR
ncbi:MAG: SAM-dependent chlorinase/fluorinase [Chloroflexota bacterium]|nr:SAM-dependent chlorinase/fluorinase [Chloroflexota bacterium]